MPVPECRGRYLKISRMKFMSKQQLQSFVPTHITMPSKPVAKKEEDSLVSAPSLTRLSSLAELQRDTPAATRAISDGFNYATKSIVSNPLVIAVPTLALALINYFAHQIFPFVKVQYK